MLHTYTESEHQKYFPSLFASQLPQVQCSKFYLLFLYKIFHYIKNCWVARRIIGQKLHERKKKKKDLWAQVYHQNFEIRGIISIKGALELFCTPSPSTNIL